MKATADINEAASASTSCDRLVDAARAGARLSEEAKRFAATARDAADDVARAAKSQFRRGVRGIEDAKEQATASIRRRPFTSLAAAFLLGAGTAALAIALRAIVGRRRARTPAPDAWYADE